MNLENMKFGFIGAGNMAQAIINGAIKGIVKPENVWASAPTRNNLDKLSVSGCNTTQSNADVLKNCDVILLCVKPFKLKEALENLNRHWKQHHIVISIISGIKISTLYQNYRIPKELTIIRVIPNLPVLVHCGIFGYTISPQYSEMEQECRTLIQSLFGTLGICEEFPEHLLDVVVGLCGSGPAYVFTVIQSMSDGAVKMGMARQLATKLAAQTVMGAAKMVLETEKHPDVLRDEVCSPSGTTIRGVYALEKAAVRSAFMDAVEAATQRATEQGKLAD